MSVQHAKEIFTAGVEAVKPAVLMRQHLSLEGDVITAGGQKFNVSQLDTIYLFCFGKAAAAMAVEVENILGKKVRIALVVTKYGHMQPLKHYAFLEAGHPVPDNNSVVAAKAINLISKGFSPSSLILCCISGGASSLLGDIAPGITLDDVQQLSTLLLQCGADIYEINTVRKHISTLKGGRLIQQANNANVVSFIISDVLGDDLSVIASGPTVADPSTFKDAFKVLQKYDIVDECPLSIIRYIIEGMRGDIPETPKPDDALFNKVANNIIGSNHVALQAAVAKAQELGYHTVKVNSGLKGDAEAQAVLFVQQLLAYKGNKPACFLMGGETTVIVKGNGKGGRNQHFVLACINELVKLNVPAANIPVILSGGTDGTDGPTDAAGAFIDQGVVEAILVSGLHPATYLNNNDAYNFFRQVNALLITGPTQTNVMDIVVGLVH